MIYMQQSSEIINSVEIVEWKEGWWEVKGEEGINGAGKN